MAESADNARPCSHVCHFAHIQVRAVPRCKNIACSNQLTGLVDVQFIESPLDASRNILQTALVELIKPTD
jgi:hypothetical protein